MRGEVYRLPARGKGHERQGRRYAVVLQPDWLTLSTSVVAFTSTSAREASFRPVVGIADRPTLVMCDQLATVDLVRLIAGAGTAAPSPSGVTQRPGCLTAYRRRGPTKSAC